MSKVDTDKYLEFVNGVTSTPSQNHDAFVYRVQELIADDFETHRLLTASVGMCAEAGEFTESKRLSSKANLSMKKICST